VLKAACYSDDKGWVEVEDLATVSELRKSDGNILWAREDVRDLQPEDVELIKEEFDLQPHAVEAAVLSRGRPTLEWVDDDLYAVVHELIEEDDQLEAVQIAAFVGNDYILVLHEGAEKTLAETEKRLEELDEVPGPHRLLRILFEVVVDEYQDVADELEDDIENIEDIILQSPEIVHLADGRLQRQLYTLKQQVARLRRYVLPWTRWMEEALEEIRGEHEDEEDAVDQPRKRLRPQRLGSLRALHDRLMRVADQVRNVDELASALLDLARAEQAERLNIQNRRLSAWAAIFAVATVIAGIYGMNFRLVPKDQTLYGFWIAMVMIAVSTGGLYLYFKKKGWL
jgi:magnesium transporter